jgi:hypothetical protein
MVGSGRENINNSAKLSGLGPNLRLLAFLLLLRLAMATSVQDQARTMLDLAGWLAV